jgi:hypothetical protein
VPSLGLCVCEEEGGDGAGLAGDFSSLNSGAWCGRNKVANSSQTRVSPAQG